MILEEYISYKTFYYFIKGDLNLDPYFYNDITQNFKSFADNGYKTEEFNEIYEKVSGDKNLFAALKTKYGNIVFFGYEDNENICDFLKRNTKQTSGAMFLTHRGSDSHQVVLAENSEIVRNICYMEEEHILEGKKTKFEKDQEVNLKLDEDGFFEKEIDEEFIYNFSIDYMGFNKDEDLEILDFKVFEFELFRPPDELDDNVFDDIIERIHNNLKRQNLTKLTINFIKFENDDMLNIFCDHVKNENCYYLFSKTVKNIKNKKEFKTNFLACLNFISKCDFEKYKKPTFESYVSHKLIDKLNYDICSIPLELDDGNDLFIALLAKDKIGLQQNEIIKTMVKIKNFRPKHWKYVHKYLMKNLNPKSITKN